jgi:hypothetical protein
LEEVAVEDKDNRFRGSNRLGEEETDSNSNSVAAAATNEESTIAIIVAPAAAEASSRTVEAARGRTAADLLPSSKVGVAVQKKGEEETPKKAVPVEAEAPSNWWTRPKLARPREGPRRGS